MEGKIGQISQIYNRQHRTPHNLLQITIAESITIQVFKQTLDNKDNVSCCDYLTCCNGLKDNKEEHVLLRSVVQSTQQIIN